MQCLHAHAYWEKWLGFLLVTRLHFVAAVNKEIKTCFLLRQRKDIETSSIGYLLKLRQEILVAAISKHDRIPGFSWVDISNIRLQCGIKR